MRRISNTRRRRDRPRTTPRRRARAPRRSDEIRAVWDINVFGVLAVYQAMLPLLRESSDARIVNVSSGVGSLTRTPTRPFRTTRCSARSIRRSKRR